MSLARARRTAIAATAVGALLSTSACLSSGSPEDESSGEEMEFLSLAWQPKAMDSVKKSVKQWNEDNPDTPIQVRFGDWGSVDDELTTAFEGGKEPDIIHYESGPLKDFVDRGEIADLSEYLSDETKEDIRESAWDAAQYAGDEGVYGIPFLQETQVIFVNTKAAKDAKVELPTVDDPWTWEEYRAAAKKLTKDSNNDGTPEQFGASFPLKNPSDRLLNLGPSASAGYFTGSGKEAKASVGAEELFIPEQIHGMLYDDKTADTGLVNASGSDSIPAFLSGQNATLLAPVYLRDAITSGAKDDFEWDTVPIPEKDSLAQGSTAQAYSVTEGASDKEGAVRFLEYMTNAENQKDMALGDWLIPTSKEAAKDPAFNTDEDGWDVAIATAEQLTKPDFQGVNGIEEWTARVSNPAFGDYFSNKIDSKKLGSRLTDDGNEVLKRHQR